MRKALYPNAIKKVQLNVCENNPAGWSDNRAVFQKQAITLCCGYQNLQTVKCAFKQPLARFLRKKAGRTKGRT